MEILRSSSSSITLRSLFAIVTCCCIFFALLKISPLLTFILTIWFAPAMIRSAWLADKRRRMGLANSLHERIRTIGNSLFVVLAILAFGAAGYALVCIAFVLYGLMFGIMVSRDVLYDAMVLGMTGGLVWGVGGFLFASAIAAVKLWTPEIYR